MEIDVYSIYRDRDSIKIEIDVETIHHRILLCASEAESVSSLCLIYV